MDKVPFKSFVLPFYQKTFGFWTLLLLFGGVFMEVRQHILLGRFLFRTPLAFWILPLGFVVFSIFHWRFQLSLIRKKEYLIFHQLALFTAPDFRKFWLLAIGANHGILLGYLVFLSYFGIEQNSFGLTIILWCTIVGCLLFNYLEIRRSLQRPIEEISILRPKVSWAFPRFTWVLLHLRQNRPLLFLLSKGLSLILLNAFFLSFHSGGYDFRWLEFGILCLSYLQIPVLMEKTEFEFQHQSWILGLPYSPTQKFHYQLGSICLLVFPEILFLFWKGGMGSTYMNSIQLWGMMLGILLLLTQLIYQKITHQDYLKWVLGSFFCVFLGILFDFPWFTYPILAIPYFLLALRSPYHY